MEFLVSGPVEDVDRTALVDKHLLDRVVLEFNCHDHGIVLLVVDVVEIIVSKGDGRHTMFMVRIGYVIDGLEVTKVFLPD